MPKCTDPFPFGECQICQDKATGMHYGVAACQGCKGFFKRSILRNVKYVCYTGGSCPITPQTRSRCKACRYHRCVETGMSMGSIKMGRIPKAQKELALANLHGTADQEETGGDQCEDRGDDKEHAEVKQEEEEEEGATGLLPDLKYEGDELEQLELSESHRGNYRASSKRSFSSQKPIENFGPLHVDRPSLHVPALPPSSSTSLVPLLRDRTQRGYQSSQSLHQMEHTMTASVSKLIDEKYPNIWANVNSGRAGSHAMGGNIHQNTESNIQRRSILSSQSFDMIPKSASPVHYSAEVITELIHQVRQQPSSSRTEDVLTQLFGNSRQSPPQPVWTANQQHIYRPLQLTNMEMMHSTITKLILIETGLESDVITMNAEISGSLQPHRLNMLQEATREDATYVWDKLFESIPLSTDNLMKFCRQFPGMSGLGRTQMDLIRKNYFEIWILQYSELYCHGDFYLRFPGGARYSVWWMKLILPREVVDSMVNICKTLEYYKVPLLLRKIMVAIILFDSTDQNLAVVDATGTLQGHYMDVLGEAVQNHYGVDDKTVILEMFKLMSSLKHCARKMASVVGDYKTGQLPDPCIQYLSEKTAQVLDISSANEEEGMTLDHDVL